MTPARIETDVSVEWVLSYAVLAIVVRSCHNRWILIAAVHHSKGKSCETLLF